MIPKRPERVTIFENDWRFSVASLETQWNALQHTESNHLRKMVKIRFMERILETQRKSVIGREGFYNQFHNLLWAYLHLEQEWINMHGDDIEIPRSHRRMIRATWRSIFRCLDDFEAEDIPFLFHINHQVNSYTSVHKFVHNQILEIFLSNREASEASAGGELSFYGITPPGYDKFWVNMLRNERDRNRRIIKRVTNRLNVIYAPVKSIRIVPRQKLRRAA